VPAGPPSGSLGSPGRSALAAYRQRRATELVGWTRSLAWRAPLVAAAGLAANVLATQVGLPHGGLIGLAVVALLGWRLRFRPSEQARSWRRGAHGERRTARRLDRLTRDGYVVFHDLAVPGNTGANVDHLVIGPSGVFVIDSKQWTGSVHQSTDGLVWHNHYPLDRTLERVRWEAAAVGRLLGTRTHPLRASTAPTSMAAACTPGGWPSCLPACSAAPSAMTGSCPRPRWCCSPPPPGPGSTRRPDHRKYGGKDIEGCNVAAPGRLLAARGLLQRWRYDTPAQVGRHGGSQHGKTTTHGHHSNVHQGTQEALKQVQGQPIGVRPAEG
jgi:hypothetical protein